MNVSRVVDPVVLSEAERRRLERALAAARLADLRPRASVEPIVLAVAFAAGLAVVFVRHLGVLPWSSSQHGVGTLIVWALLLFGFAFSLLSAVRAHRLRWLPQGRVLTSGELLDLRGSVVHVRGLEHLEEIREPTDTLVAGDGLATLKLCFSDGSFAIFHVQQSERRAILRDLEETAARLREAAASGERATLEELQLFPDLPPLPNGEGPFRDAPTRVRFDPPAPTRRQLFVSVVVAALAPLLMWGRNAVSDELSFRRALREGDVAAWLAYLDGEPRREAEARHEHLPRARLVQARRHGIDGLRSFLRLYGDSSVADEAAEELHLLLATEGPM